MLTSILSSSIPWVTERSFSIFYLLTLVLSVYYCEAVSSSPLDTSIHLINITKYLNRKQAILTRSGFTQIFYDFIDSNVDQLYHLQVDPKCVESLIYLNRSLENGDPWAFKMLDSSGRNPIDFTGLGYIGIGNFEQCINLKWTNGQSVEEFGQHCLISVKPDPSLPGTIAELFTAEKILSDTDFGFSMKMGFCLPSSCSKNDFQVILKKALEPFSWTVSGVDYCQISQSFGENFGQASKITQISFTLLTAFVILVIYSTWRDVHRVNSRSETVRSHWTRNLSMLTSWRSLVEPEPDLKRCPTIINCELLQHIVVLIMHAAVWPLMVGGLGIYALGHPLTKYSNKVVVKNFFGDWFMDGLFAYAGMSRSLELWSKITPESSFWTVIKLIIRKMFIFVVLFTILIGVESIVPLFVYGPFKPLIADRRAQICSQTFIANLLFYNNNIGSLDKVCAAHTWSIAAEYQLVFFLAGLVWLYKRQPRLAFTLNMILSAIGLFYVGWVFYKCDLSPHAIARGLHPSVYNKWIEMVYLPSTMHFWLYILTPAFAYLILNGSSLSLLGNRQQKSRRLVIFGLIMTLFPYIMTIISAYHETTLIVAIYIFFYRLFTGLFYGLLAFSYADEIKYYFESAQSSVESSIDKSNNNISIGPNERSNGIMKTPADNVNSLKSLNRLDNQAIKYELGASESRLKYILVTLFRSTYCIHISTFIWYYSRHSEPVVTNSEWIGHVLTMVILTYFCGLVFYLLILGPFNNYADSFKTKTVKLDRSKEE